MRKNKAAAEQILAGQVKVAYRAIMAAASKARVTGDDTALSPAAATAAMTISGELLKLNVALKGIKLTDFDADAQHLTDGFQHDVDRAAQLIAKLDAAFDRLFTTPTAAKFTELKMDKDVTTIYGVFTVGFRSMEDPRFTALNQTWKDLAELVDRTRGQVEGNKVPAGAKEQTEYFRAFVLKAKPLSTRMKTLK